jgi:hypothetical protein
MPAREHPHAMRSAHTVHETKMKQVTGEDRVCLGRRNSCDLPILADRARGARRAERRCGVDVENYVTALIRAFRGASRRTGRLWRAESAVVRASHAVADTAYFAARDQQSSQMCREGAEIVVGTRPAGQPDGWSVRRRGQDRCQGCADDRPDRAAAWGPDRDHIARPDRG